MINDMRTFSRTYYTEKLNITIRIKRDELCSMGCRLTIKDRMKRDYWGMDRIVYSQFYNDKKMFTKYRRQMIETKVPGKVVNEIIDDIKMNLRFEKVVVYQPIETKMFWD
jgi:predicted SPOUT superfamily RNA methylase MTH1